MGTIQIVALGVKPKTGGLDSARDCPARDAPQGFFTPMTSKAPALQVIQDSKP
jgi:hypothetical protein